MRARGPLATLTSYEKKRLSLHYSLLFYTRIAAGFLHFFFLVSLVKKERERGSMIKYHIKEYCRRTTREKDYLAHVRDCYQLISNRYRYLTRFFSPSSSRESIIDYAINQRRETRKREREKNQVQVESK